MSRRTLLIVTYHFPPQAASGSFRLLGFARHLPRAGWDVAVVAPPSIFWEPDDPALGRQVPPETAVHPVPFRSIGHEALLLRRRRADTPAGMIVQRQMSR